MKRVYTLFLFLFTIVACNNQYEARQEENDPTMDLSLSEEIFAKILSQAVHDDGNLRAFIKKEALNQFDKDYDVFYPFIKEQMLDDKQSVRDVLLQYTNNNILSEIEAVASLLTIYIPDYSWLGAFCPEEWDVSNEMVSVAIKRGEELIVFSNGELEGTMKKNEIADFPILIIKENERMRVSSKTRAGEITYEFVDDAFDGRNQPRTRVESIYYYIQVDEIPQPDNYVSTGELNSYVLNGYDEFGGLDNRYQRDNIYFGMTNSASTGILNTYIREYLHKFRFKSALNGALYDATTSSDPNYPDGYMPTSYTQKGQAWPLEVVQALDFQIEGNLEMRFHVIYGNTAGELSTNTIACSVPFEDLFSYDKVYVDFKHATWFTREKRTYTLNPSCLVPKWCTLDIALPISAGAVWNIGTTSTSIKIKVEEYDSGETTTSSTSLTYTTSTNVSTTNEGEHEKNSYGTTNSISHTTSNSYTKTNLTDVLGEVILNYVDPVVLNKDGYKYEMMTYDTGSVVMMIIPKHL